MIRHHSLFFKSKGKAFGLAARNHYVDYLQLMTAGGNGKEEGTGGKSRQFLGI
jgi:hypothetical protein